MMPSRSAYTTASGMASTMCRNISSGSSWFIGDLLNEDTRYGQAHGKAGADAWLAFGGDRSPHHVDESPRDRQAQAPAPVAPQRRGLYPREFFEYLLHILDRDAD